MAIRPEFNRYRTLRDPRLSLFDDAAPERPGLFGRLKRGAGDVLGTLFGGADDPRLSDEANRRARSQAMIMAGLNTVQAASQPGASAVGSLAGGAAAGQGVGAQSREALYQRDQVARIQQALQNPELMAQLSDQEKMLIQMLPPGQAVEALTEILTRQPEFTTAAPGATVLRDGVPIHTAEKPRTLPSDLEAVLFGMDADLDNMSPEQKGEAFRQFTNLVESRRAQGTTVNVSPAARGTVKAYSDAMGAGFTAAQETINNLPQIASAIEITNDPEFARVTGPFKDIKTFMEQMSGDPTAVRLAQAYDVLTGAGGLRILKNFTGPKTEKEVQIAFDLASARRELTPAELQIGLRVMRRGMAFEGAEWARSVLAAGPAIVDNNPEAWAEYKKRADALMAAYREELIRMSELGIS